MSKLRTAASGLLHILLHLLVTAAAQPAHAGGDLAADVSVLFRDLGEDLRSGPLAGSPPAIEVFKGNELVGYAFSTRAVTRSVGYSSKPLDIHVGLRTDGRIAGARLVAHEEPILVIGIKPEDLEAFVRGLAGLDVHLPLTAQHRSKTAPDHVAGATVSSTIIKDAVLRSARATAHSRGLLGSQPRLASVDRTTFEPRTWAELVAMQAISGRELKRGEVSRVLGRAEAEPDATFIEMFAALLSPAMIGQNLLGVQEYERIMARLPLDGHAILIAARGLYSYKGVDWRQIGLFDRVQLVQGQRTLRLRREMYENVEKLAVKGVPDLRETGLFLLPVDFGLDPLQPWRIELIVGGGDGSEHASAVFALEYALPRSLIRAAPASDQPAAEQRRETREPQADDSDAGAMASRMTPLWVEIWHAKTRLIAVLLAMLLVLSVILFSHDVLTRHQVAYRRARVTYLTVTLAFLGLVAGTQLSVVNVVTFTHALLSDFKWELFLVEPLTFILWCFVALSLLFWGRGVFCGWLCPFGALQELLNEGARKLGLKQIEVPWTLHERLWPIKYVAFLVILGVSFQSTSDAFRLAEIEPFKTAISLQFVRPWPFVAYALVLLGLGLFIERAYCRYLCPLGAALAIPARLRIFEWLKRRPQCGRECRICATRCTVQAINPVGQIVPNECIYCLQCQSNYYDATTCLPLKQRAMRKGPAKPGEGE